MKEVFVVRHGKSSWENPSWKDVERPLLKKGKKRTERIAKFLFLNGFKPDLILTSHAKRARMTAKILAGYWEEDIPVQVEEIIYHGDENDLETLLYGLDNRIKRVFIIGHNPDLTDWVNKYKEEPIWNLPTSGVFGIRFKTAKWENIALADYREILYLEPKMLK